MLCWRNPVPTLKSSVSAKVRLSWIDIALSTFGPLTNGIFACTGFLITSVLQLFLLMKAACTKMEQAGKLEREVVESRVAVFLSQIQPHFLYNILTGIQYLCAEDPAKAEQAVTDFTMFLRGNLDSLSRNAPILLSQEMEHVRHYLALAQLRYDGRLHVEWDLCPMNILVPALSVQPLVENAVRWGMLGSGITVRIATKTTEKGHIITVEDNGKGFDPHAKQPPRGTGIGIASIRTRVCEIYGGSRAFSAYALSDVIVRRRNFLAVNTKVIDCDLYRMQHSDMRAFNTFRREYMSGYAWASLPIRS